MLFRFALLLALLPGCVGIVTQECVSEERILDEDETIGDLAVSARDLLDVMEGTHAFAGTYARGDRAVTGAATVARGAGDIVGIDGTIITEKRNGGFGIGTIEMTMALMCDDSLAVPVDVALRTDDGEVDITLAAEAIADTVGGVQGGVPELTHIEGDVAAEGIVAMPDSHVGEAVPGLSLQFTSRRFDFVSLWWNGEDYEQVLEASPAR